MAYNKKTWLARLGQGLNKFSIDGATPVPIISQPDSVTQQGDALSAGNLNDLEQRIADAFDDVEESKADKSTTDALQSQINQHESRLENLEQKAGDYTTVQYRGTDAVPTGKAKNGLVEKIVGKSRAWNQLYNYTGERTKLDVKATMASGAITLSGTSNSTGNGPEFAWTDFTQPKGHAYIILTDLQLPAGDFIFDVYNSNYVNIIGRVFKTTQSFIIPQLKIANSGVNYTGITGRLYIRDLSVIFPEYTADQLVSMGWDTLVQMLPDLAKFDSVNLGSLVSTEVSAVKSVGVNIWDEVTESGGIDSLGDDVVDNTKIRSKNFIPITPNVEYYCKTTKTIGARFYDSSKNYISPANITNTNFTTPINAYYLRFQVVDCTSYANDIQICLNSYADKTTYHPYMTDTISLPSPVTLRSSGNVVDTDELNVEVLVDEVKVNRRRQTTRVGRHTFIQSDNWILQTGTMYAYAFTDKDSSNNCLLSGGYSKVGSYADCSTTNMSYYVGGGADNPNLFVNNSGFTSASVCAELMSGNVVQYPLATESVTLLEPIIENFIEVEGGGTIDTIQEQSPVIDNYLDVGYLTV